MLNKIIRYFLDNKLVTTIIILLFIGWGLVTAPFGWWWKLWSEPSGVGNWKHIQVVLEALVLPMCSVSFVSRIIRGIRVSQDVIMVVLEEEVPYFPQVVLPLP